jgi:hypothetical protein
MHTEDESRTIFRNDNHSQYDTKRRLKLHIYQKDNLSYRCCVIPYIEWKLIIFVRALQNDYIKEMTEGAKYEVSI